MGSNLVEVLVVGDLSLYQDVVVRDLDDTERVSLEDVIQERVGVCTFVARAVDSDVVIVEECMHASETLVVVFKEDWILPYSVMPLVSDE